MIVIQLHISYIDFEEHTNSEQALFLMSFEQKKTTYILLKIMTISASIFRTLQFESIF